MSNYFMSSDLATPGVYRAMIHWDGTNVKVQIPCLSDNIENTDENSLMTGTFASEDLKRTALVGEAPGFVGFENGVSRRPVILGYFGKGIRSIGGGGAGGVGIGGFGKKVLIVPGHSKRDIHEPAKRVKVETNFGEFTYTNDARGAECEYTRKTARYMSDYIEAQKPGLSEVYSNIDDYNRSLFNDVFEKKIDKGFFNNYQAIIEIHFNSQGDGMFLCDEKQTDDTVVGIGVELVKALRQAGYPGTDKVTTSTYEPNKCLVTQRCSIIDGNQAYYYMETKNMDNGVSDEDCKKIGEALGKVICDHYDVISGGSLETVVAYALQAINEDIRYSQSDRTKIFDDNANPKYADCSSFIHWCYYKAGIIPYSNGNAHTTGSFWTSEYFDHIAGPNTDDCKKISPQPGDVLLRSASSTFDTTTTSHVLICAPGNYNGTSFNYVNCGGGGGVGKASVKGVENWITGRSYHAILRLKSKYIAIQTNSTNKGTISEFTDDLKQYANINGPAKITYDDLRYLTIPHLNFNGGTSTGHMVVHKDIASEVIEIFAELMSAGYPIENMQPVTAYGNSDSKSIDANNTSAFNNRGVTTTGGTSNTPSNHAYGKAIDINPFYNPYVSVNGDYTNRIHNGDNVKIFVNRDVSTWPDKYKKVFIGKNTKIYNIFKKHGWTWLPEAETDNDYQHFQKI